MPLDRERILAHRFEPVEERLTDERCMLYALSIGLGADTAPDELRYVYERQLEIFPTLPLVLGYPGTWFLDPAFGITRERIVHATQRLELYEALHPGDTVVATHRNTQVVDKGAAKGAIVVTERLLTVEGRDTPCARIEQGMMCRADGGFGGPSAMRHEPAPLPERAADARITLPTATNQALLYRLNADRNPLHADPAFAIAAGFPRPILHGLCTYALAARALTMLDADMPPLRDIEARFSAPVLPGETLVFDVWQEGASAYAFRARVEERGVTTLDRGRARFAPWSDHPARPTRATDATSGS